MDHLTAAFGVKIERSARASGFGLKGTLRSMFDAVEDLTGTHGMVLHAMSYWQMIPASVLIEGAHMYRHNARSSVVRSSHSQRRGRRRD